MLGLELTYCLKIAHQQPPHLSFDSGFGNRLERKMSWCSPASLRAHAWVCRRREGSLGVLHYRSNDEPCQKSQTSKYKYQHRVKGLRAILDVAVYVFGLLVLLRMVPSSAQKWGQVVTECASVFAIRN